MRLRSSGRHFSVGALLVAHALTLAPSARAAPKVRGTRPVVVAGLTSDPHNEDVLGLARIQFQGLIAGELATVGYHVVDLDAAPSRREVSSPPLSLIGIVKEEICDEQSPRQCRIALQWELRNQKGVVVYRTLTRAVDQAGLETERRDLIKSALRSLLARPRFTLQLTDPEDASRPLTEPLGFKRCGRPDLALPEAARAVAASYVLVESGSHLAGGAILSPDGLVLTEASVLSPGAPLLVRLSARQKLAAEVVAVERKTDVALLRVSAHFDTTCLPLAPRRLAVGEAVFGVSSPLSEERATSLNGSVVQGVRERDGVALLQTDARIAQAEGAPLLDASGRLAGLVTGHLLHAGAASGAQAVDVQSALDALYVAPAPVTDPRLMEAAAVRTDVGYVRDADDPPFTLTQRYTYGTSTGARTLRKVGLWTGVAGAAGVFATWVSFRGSDHLSPHAYNRLVVLNDLSWGVFALGAVGFGVSFALPEAHDMVAVRVESAQRGPARLGLAPFGLTVSGRL